MTSTTDNLVAVLRTLALINGVANGYFNVLRGAEGVVAELFIAITKTKTALSTLSYNSKLQQKFFTLSQKNTFYFIN